MLPPEVFLARLPVPRTYLKGIILPVEIVVPEELRKAKVPDCAGGKLPFPLPPQPQFPEFMQGQ